MRDYRYRQIADAIGASITDRTYEVGRLLPSESELSQSYEASRVTVRKALDHLRDQGLVDSRQGFGWYVAADPLRQTLGRLGTIEENLSASGLTSTRDVVDFSFERAEPDVAEALGCEEVLRVRRRNLAARGSAAMVPFALVTVWCPATLAADLSRSDVERSSFFDLLGVEIAGATQTIGAAVASADEAELLDVPVGSPLLSCRRVTRAADGSPVLFSRHLFPAHLTEFEVELTSPPASMGPSGLRLVEGLVRP